MSDYDYTKNDVPFDESPDDFLIGNVASAADKDVDAVEKDNRFLQVPPGEQVLQLVGFMALPAPRYFKCFVNGQMTGFSSHAVAPKFALASNPKATISDNFVLPPADAAGLQAYFHGIPESSTEPGVPSKMQAGIMGNRFSHFINRLGFVWGPGQNFPVEAQRLGNWKGRLIGAKVKAGNGTYKAKDGTERDRNNSIEWFSYKKVDGAGAPATVPLLPGGQGPRQGNGQAVQSRPAVNVVPVPVSVGSAGLDVI